MRAVLGIGNPGRKYANTRHNIGFIILDRFAEKHGLRFIPSKGDYYKAGGVLNISAFVLAKPTTYVNLSGIAARDLLKRSKIRPDDLLVVSDDVNLSEARIRVRLGGSHGGHNGLKSLIANVGTKEFPRLRFGVGSDFESGEMADYVLSRFTNKALDTIGEPIDHCVRLIEEFILGGTKDMLEYFSKNSNEINSVSQQLKKKGN